MNPNRLTSVVLRIASPDRARGDFGNWQAFPNL